MAGPLFNLVSADAQVRLTEFSDAYAMALAMLTPDVWSKTFGLTYSSNAIKTTYPIPVSAAGYKLRQGDDKMRRLYEKSLSIIPTQYSDGVSALARIVEAPDFIGWADEPSRIALETLRFPNLLVRDLLHSNPTLAFDGLSLFNDSHPINVLDDGQQDVNGNTTFDNNFSSGTVGTALFESAVQYFNNVPGPNGQVLGLKLSHVLVPSALERKFATALSGDLMYSAILNQGGNTNQVMKNLYTGMITPVHCPELKDADVVYWIADNGPKPWIVQDGGSPEEIRYEKDSDYYKDTGYLGVKYILNMGTAAALPHAIAKQQITG